MHVFEYTPQPKQLLLHSAKAKEIFYGGAAGGGKSHALRWDGIEFCLRVPGLNAFLFRRTMPELETNHIDVIKADLGNLVGRYNESKNRYEFKNGSVMWFRHMEHEKDKLKNQGAEIHWLGMDEAGLFAPTQIGYVRSRLRLGGFEHKLQRMCAQHAWMQTYYDRLPRMVLASNPGGESHHYLKENYIDPWPMGMRAFNGTTLSGKNISRIFIPAGMQDNEYLDEDYEIQFDELPDWQRRQLVDGDWNVIPGSYFDCWGPQNVVKPFKIPDHWHRFWICDWGFRQPFYIGELVVSDGSPVWDVDGKKLDIKSGCLILVWEWYGQEKGNKGVRMNAFDVGQILVQKRGQLDGPHYGDPSMWRTDSGPSAGERFANANVVWAWAERERVPGWQEMYARIKDLMFLAFETCPVAIRIIPTLRHDERAGKEEDVEKKGEDHAGDAIRYGCMSRPYKKNRPGKDTPYWYRSDTPTFNEIMARHVRQDSKAFRQRI